MKRRTTEEFIQEVIALHGNVYDYSLVQYINQYTKIKIVCSKHGIFEQAPNHHLRGSGCPICGGKTKSNRKDFIHKAISVHADRYDYSKVDYINNKIPVIITCKTHGDFSKSPAKHLQGSGCSICAKNKKLTTEEFIKRAIATHDTHYDYSSSNYINSNSKIKIICRKHGEFYQNPNNHLNGYGCPSCRSNKMSKIESKWLDSIGIHIENRQMKIRLNEKSYIIDGFDPKTNTCYEFNGDYWHGNPEKYSSEDINPHTKQTFGELYNKTIDKENVLIDNGFNIVSIWESDYRKSIKK